jgi:monothiol glutaredoxin
MRPLLNESAVSTKAINEMKSFHPEVLKQVQEAISKNEVVVVGMKQNPFVKKVRKALEEQNIQFVYLEYGSYLSAWKKRLAIKLWSGWPTFPQVFVKGKLIGGNAEAKALLASGELKKH